MHALNIHTIQDISYSSDFKNYYLFSSNTRGCHVIAHIFKIGTNNFTRN